MIRFLIAALTVTIAVNGTAQSIDSISIAAAANLIDMKFTRSEIDSMQNRLRSRARIYQRMHQNDLPNSQPYALEFHPQPAGYKVPVNQLPVKWNIPENVSLPSNRNDLAFYSIPQLASLIRSRKISSVDLTLFFIDRLKKWGDTLQCVVTLTPLIAMQEAKAADDELRRGIYRGPLHGIPYGLKDLFAVKGTKTTWGAAPYMNQQVDENAFVYLQLKSAGAVLCAKLTLGALAMGDFWFGGQTKNPWNLTVGSSGSSAGSASATVAGLLPFAIGTETLGSIVSPAHVCGATGLRPTFGSVSRTGAMVLSWTLDKIGPICRSAEDAAIVFYYIRGTDGKDRSAMNHAFNYTGKTDLKKLRIAYASNYFRNLPETSPQWQVIETFRKAGARVESVIFPDSIYYPFNFIDPILNAECAAAFDAFTRSDLDDQLTRQTINDWPNTFRTARFIPAVEYINANRHRSRLVDSMALFMKHYDVLIVPTFTSILPITNLTGNPVVCLPVGYGENGMPTSITLVGNLFDEATILAAAKVFQDATDFNKKRPQKFVE